MSRTVVEIYNKQYSSSGLLLIEEFDNEYYVILFRNSRTNIYSDLGGRIDKDDLNSSNPLLTAALREAKEESLNLVNFENMNNKLINKIYKYGLYVDNKFDKYYYRCFCLTIPAFVINRDHYKKNHKIIFNSDLPRFWKETDRIRRFKISDIVTGNCLVDGYCNDVNGKSCKISFRTKMILKECINNNMEELSSCIRLRIKETIDRKLLNTTSYVL